MLILVNVNYYFFFYLSATCYESLSTGLSARTVVTKLASSSNYNSSGYR